MVSSQSGDTPSSNPYIVEDEFHVVWDFDKEAEGETHVSHTSTVPTTLAKPGKKGFSLKVPFRKQTTSGIYSSVKESSVSSSVDRSPKANEILLISNWEDKTNC